MDVIALVISGLALAVSGLGMVLSDMRARASGRIAQGALDEARNAATRGLWADAVEATHRILFDPASEPVGEKMATLRVRFTALIDGLPTWDCLDRWLAAEHVLGSVLARELLAKADSMDDI